MNLSTLAHGIPAMPKGQPKSATEKAAEIKARMQADQEALNALDPALIAEREKKVKDENFAMGPVWRAAMEEDPRLKVLFVRNAGKLSRGYHRKVLTTLLGPLPEPPKADGKDEDRRREEANAQREPDRTMTR